MKALGFNFNKISIEKLSSTPKAEEIKVTTNINIIDVVSTKADLLKTKDELINIKFDYTINYEPDFAKLEFSGEVLVEIEPKLAKETLKNWKDKGLPEELKIFVFNIVLMKSNVKSVELEEDLNLPFHIPLPTIPLNRDKKKE